ncbi:MAG: lipM [Planctomycetaceae bacterium]|nr:lipM [Planctomycetaceae bacterium]
MMPVCQVVLDTPARSGAWNMAMDEALLEAVVEGADTFLRWYQWNEATLSLGYFQPPEDAHADPSWAGLPIVRRLSGGGAIIHEHELTYSCALPATHSRTNDPYQLYLDVHEALIQVFRSHDFDVQLRGTRFGKEGPAEAFLCFSRGDEMDVVWRGHKVLGSAQRRRRGAILQHGSLVLRKSAHAPQFPGLFDLGQAVDVSELLEEMAQAVGRILGPQQVRTSFNPAILKRAQQLHDDRYLTLAWSRGNPLTPKE